MRIDDVNNLAAASALKRKRTNNSSGADGEFASLVEGSDEGDEKQPAAISSPVNISPITTLIIAQEEASSEEEIKKQVKRGKTILDELDELRHGLLMGSIPAHIAYNLARAAKSDSNFNADPRLSEIISEIELRAEVELAKLQRDRE